MGNERRVHHRNDYSGTLQLQCAGETTWFAVHGRDVSAGGFSFFSAFQMRRGERVTVWAPEVDAATFPAVVRHVKPEPGGYIVGIEFDDVIPEPIERALNGG